MRYNHLIAVSGFALTVALAPLSAQAADIVQTLEESGQFSILVDAIEKAGLTETLQGEGPYTVFAPTDEAFQKLEQGGSEGQQQSGQSQQQSGQSQQSSQDQQQAAQSQQQSSQGQQQSGQGQQQGSDGQVLQQVSSDQLKQILTHHVVEGQELRAKDVLGKEQKVGTISGDQLTVDGTGTMVVLVPTGLTLTRVGDEVFVRRDAAAMMQPAVTVSTTGQQGDQSQQQSGQQSSQSQQTSGQSGQQSGQGQQQASGQSGQQSGQSQQQAAGHSGQQGGQGQQQAAGQSGGQGQEQPMAEQQGLLRAAMVVEPDLQADNGVIHAIDQVLVPQKVEQELMSGQSQGGGQQKQG